LSRPFSPAPFVRLHQLLALSQVGRLSAWALRPIQPVSRRLSACWPSLPGTSSPRWRVRPSSRSAYREHAGCYACMLPDPIGVTTFRTGRDANGVGALFTPGSRCPSGLPPGKAASRQDHRGTCHLTQPCRRSRSGKLRITGPHRGFTGVHPSVLSLARSPDSAPSSLGLHPVLHTPPLPATHAGVRNRLRTLALEQACPLRPGSRQA
jgi:hypothetical protein